jgi:hypothetical protein
MDALHPANLVDNFTKHACETQTVVHALLEFGLKHRKKIKGK